MEILDLLSTEARWWSSAELVRRFAGSAIFETLHELLEKKRIVMQDDAPSKHDLPKLKYKITEKGKVYLLEMLKSTKQ